jgi:hypothetical protein
VGHDGAIPFADVTSGRTEVDEDRRAVFANQYVRRLDIAVPDAVGVCMLQAVEKGE